MGTALKDKTEAEKEDKKLAEEAIHWNSMAIANLTTTMTMPTTVTIVYKAHSVEWPNRLASNVVKALKKKYCPEDVTALVELCNKLLAVRMKKSERPLALFKRLSQIESQYSTATRHLAAVDLLAAAMKAAPAMYALVITVSQTTKGKQFDLETMEETMEIFYCQLAVNKPFEGNNNNNNKLKIGADGICGSNPKTLESWRAPCVTNMATNSTRKSL